MRARGCWLHTARPCTRSALHLKTTARLCTRSALHLEAAARACTRSAMRLKTTVRRLIGGAVEEQGDAAAAQMLAVV